MSRRPLAILAAALLLAACGRYGPPVRAGELSTGTAQHAAGCNDPDHDHDETQPEAIP